MAPGENFDAAPVAPAPTIYQANFFKTSKSSQKGENIFFS
jgi:hypothetical protein